MSRVIAIMLLAAMLAAAARSAPRVTSEPRRESVEDAANGPARGTAAAESLLVLKNGSLLRGRITWSGDHYFVDRQGAQIGIRAHEVECLARDLDDAYRQKREPIRADDLEARQRLAEWCLRHELHGHAALELSLCRELQPRNMRTAELARRLQLASQARRERSPADEAASPMARPQDANEEKGKATNEVPKNEADPLDELPADVVETFAVTIQPMLINQCAGGGCHGLGSKNEFTLTRFNPRKTSSRAYTRRNLEAVLRQIDRGTPSESPLLATARLPHGGTKTAVFHGRNMVQYEQLERWVRRLAGQPSNHVDKNGDAAAVTRSAGRHAESADNQTGQASSSKGDERKPAVIEAPTVAEATITPGAAADEFNRRYHPETKDGDEPAPPIDPK